MPVPPVTFVCPPLARAACRADVWAADAVAAADVSDGGVADAGPLGEDVSALIPSAIPAPATAATINSTAKTGR